MRALFRDLTLVVACVISMAACAGNNGGGSPVELTPAQMRSAMPDRESLPAGWRGEADPQVLEGKDAFTKCLSMAASCRSAGQVVMGTDSYDQGTVNRGDGDFEHTAHVVVLSFESIKAADAVMKNLASSGRSRLSPQPTQINAGAQVTEAWSENESDGYVTRVTMRVDRVVVGIVGEKLKQPGDIQPIAKILVVQVNKASQG
ncbi:hypothetical protein ABZ930_36875 [Streptomyces sp. NPDC046716]|uniref:hypothetical protein n=1 Tax=Streptomyces sp. NPDC046716 TaxID=3157093 RepID=UPI0033CFD5C0